MIAIKKIQNKLKDAARTKKHLHDVYGTYNLVVNATIKSLTEVLQILRGAG